MIKVRLKSNTILNQLARKNLSQNSLARRLGITSGYMSQLLRGHRNPSSQLRSKISEWLKDLAFDDLFEIVQ